MAIDWFEAIDTYCERTDATIWSEPLNALSNLAFIAAFVASVYCYRRYREEAGQHRWEFVLLLGLLCAIGIGSFLCHTFATRWALVADVGPITLFQFAYLGIFCWHILAPRWWVVLAGWAAFVVTTLLLAIPFPADYKRAPFQLAAEFLMNRGRIGIVAPGGFGVFSAPSSCCESQRREGHKNSGSRQLW